MTVREFMGTNKIDYKNAHLQSPVLQRLFTLYKSGGIHLDTEKQFTDLMNTIYYSGASDLATRYDLALGGV